MLKKLLEPQKTLLRVCNSLEFEKKSPKSFFSPGWKLFLWKVVSNDLIGPTENVFLVAQKMSKYCLNPFILFFEICPIL